MSHVLPLMSNIFKKRLQQNVCKASIIFTSWPSLPQIFDLLPSFYLVLAQIQFTEWTLLCISSVQIHIHTAQSNSKEMSVHPYRETCFDSWRLLAFNIVRNLYCLMWSATLKIWMPVCTKEAVWTNCCEKY